MNWNPFSKKNPPVHIPEQGDIPKMKPEGEATPIVLNMPDIYRHLMYDSEMDNVEEIMHLMGYSSQSREVTEMSLKESNERVRALSPITPVIELLVNSLNAGMGTYMRQQVGTAMGGIIEEEVIQAMIEAHDELLMDNVTAILANLLDLKFIQIGEYYVDSVSDLPKEGK